MSRQWSLRIYQIRKYLAYLIDLDVSLLQLQVFYRTNHTKDATLHGTIKHFLVSR